MNEENRDCAAQALELLGRSGLRVSDDERRRLRVLDFGLGRPRIEGAQVIDIVRSASLRIVVLVLLPGQTLPEHLHPAYPGTVGKEEHVRVQDGGMTVYLPGDDGGPASMPAGRERYYRCRRGTELGAGQSLFVPPATPHWFQAGRGGCVSLGFYTAVDESRNVFTDPSAGLAG